ncbi:MAG: asparagine synthase (glutamine-hydrolyzing) [Syntrophobacteraceae bacterium]
MCGIAGIKSIHREALDLRIQAMIDVFPYRGPDADGIWVQESKGLAFGHRRLSILDTSSAGTQPMSDSAGRFWITFNGEVYNYIELREELKAKGHVFRTNTDTEVILAAYSEWGCDCVRRFNGMWAFAIWDTKEELLFLARDRLGVKPLYYYSEGGTFYFASEVKAILKAIASRPEINSYLVDALFSYGYIPGEDTLCAGVKRLLPGHYMIVGADGNTRVFKYWDLVFNNGEDRGKSYYLREARNLLESAIDLRLRSDVPLGIFLSGGIDSSTVVGLLAPKVSEPLKTFSVAYDLGRQFNETPYARMVADRFATDHHEVFVTPIQFQEFIPGYVALMDEPVAEAAAISLYFVSRLAKEYVTVVLSGEGSDEIFAGYDFYRYMNLLERYRKLLPSQAPVTFSNLSGRLLPGGSRLRKYMELGALPLEKRYRGISTYEEYYKHLLYLPEFTEFVSRLKGSTPLDGFIGDLFSATRDNDSLSRMLYFDTKTWLVDDLLIKADRMSMAASLELRVPFLDYRLVEFCARMPSRYKMSLRNNKILLKDITKGFLPRPIIDRKKMGFPTPLKTMFEKELYGYARELLLSPSAHIRSYLRADSVEKVLKDHASRRVDYHRIIWLMLVLENWMQAYHGSQQFTLKAPLCTTSPSKSAFLADASR